MSFVFDSIRLEYRPNILYCYSWFTGFSAAAIASMTAPWQNDNSSSHTNNSSHDNSYSALSTWLSVTHALSVSGKVFSAKSVRHVYIIWNERIYTQTQTDRQNMYNYIRSDTTYSYRYRDDAARHAELSRSDIYIYGCMVTDSMSAPSPTNIGMQAWLSRSMLAVRHYGTWTFYTCAERHDSTAAWHMIESCGTLRQITSTASVSLTPWPLYAHMQVRSGHIVYPSCHLGI